MFLLCSKMTALELQDKDSHIGSEAVKKAMDSLSDNDFKVINHNYWVRMIYQQFNVFFSQQSSDIY